MRFPAFTALFIVGIAVSGCSRVGIDDLVPRPSQETTGSIARPAMPSVKVGASSASSLPSEMTALAGSESDSGFQMPSVQAAAMVPVQRPAGRSAHAVKAVVHPQQFRDAKPINFGKVKPKHYAVHGVDVSRWQGEIDWAKLRGQGANFVFIKATDGGDHLDPMFMKNWNGAAAAGIKRGAYHFFYWCRPASQQADWFIRNVPKAAGALPPVIDVEWNGESRCRKRPSAARVREKMQVFMDRLEKHYGQRPIIYTAPDFYADNLKGAFTDHPFWLRAVAQHPSKVYPGRKWAFWQYSGSGLSHGVKGNIDLNVFNGTEAQWRNWLGGQLLMADAE